MRRSAATAKAVPLRALAGAALLLGVLALVFVVAPARAGGTLDHFTVTAVGGGDIPDHQTAGQAFSVTITAVDSDGATVTGFTGTVSLSSSDGCTVGCGDVTLTNGVLTTEVTLTVAAGNATLSASYGMPPYLKVGTSNSFVLDPAAASKLDLGDTSTDTVTSGTQRVVTARVIDQYGNLVTAGAHSVDFAQTAGTGTATGLTTGVATTNGVATDTVTGGHWGSLTITAGSSGLTSGAVSFVVGASKLVFTSSNGNLTSGTGRTLTVKVEDSLGNVVTSPGRSVTITKTSGTGTVTGLPATVSSSSGIATHAVTGVLAGWVTITATSGSLKSATTRFDVTPGAARKLEFTSSAAPLSSGQFRLIKATVEDAAGNRVSSGPSHIVTFAKDGGSGPGTVTVLLSGGVRGSLPTSVRDEGGTASISVVGALAGSITITAKASGLAGASQTFTVVPGAAKKLVFVSGTTNLRTGAARELKVKIVDAAGNLVRTLRTTVTFAKSRSAGNVLGLRSVTSSAGFASLRVTATWNGVGSITIRASATGLAGAATTFKIVKG